LSSAIGVIQGFHAVVAMQRNEPHWLLNDADARRYGLALANAARHFPVKTTQRAIDMSALIFCVVQMETPRFVISRQLAAQRARGGPPRGPAQVFQFVNPNAPTPPPSATATAAAPTGAAGAGGGSPQPPMADGPIDPSSFDGALGSDPAA
jgi:hypothetical protein